MEEQTNQLTSKEKKLVINFGSKGNKVLGALVQRLLFELPALVFGAVVDGKVSDAELKAIVDRVTAITVEVIKTEL